ncbi:enoyl-CoA hydratase/isomerase family protein [Rhodococcus sp. IEGM1428]|uniref:enoyl-CoA hydratase/isomerase family protein n=1 Tax=Rhodococcus sp. IEGM1428 TaxID=3392191 RepID=UPI003D0BBAF7
MTYPPAYSDDRLIVETQKGVAVLRLNSPRNLNALDYSLKILIAETIRQQGRKSGVKGIVVTGTGRAFTAGQDLKEAPVGKKLEATMDAFADLTRAVLETKVPVIAAINGCVVGGAAEWTLCFDARIASPDAYYLFPERNIGFTYSNAASLFFHRVLRGSDVHRVALSTDRFYADEALELGLVGQIVLAEELVSTAIDQALAWSSPNGEPASELLRLLRPESGEVEAAFDREMAASGALQASVPENVEHAKF